MLTRKQHQLLVFIDNHLRSTGFSPSFEEMKEGLHLKSKSGIHRLISALEERGFLSRHHHRARALEVLKVPDIATPARPGSSRAAQPARPAKAAAEHFAPTVIQGDFTPRLTGVKSAEQAGAVQIPLYGRIAAGLPIEALANESTMLEVPITMLGAGEHYALEVAGDSMEEAGILDGDTVLIQRLETAENGQIIVALVDETEVTLKRFRRRGNSIALEPANARYEVRLLPAERVKVQGHLIGLMRRY